MRRLLLPCTLALCVLLTPAAAHAKVVIGIADNNAATFADQRFADLHLKHARTTIPWDILQDPVTLPRVEAWMAAAKAAHLKPLLSFDKSRRAAFKRKNPSPKQMAAALKAWRKHWPGQVSEIAAWNEPNIANKSPKRVAKWWLALRKACRTCTVLPGELVDRSNAVKWAKDFVKAAKRTPSIWALHAYVDANNLRDTRTKAFEKAVKGKLWLTETGGVVMRTHPSVKFKGTGVAFQTKATSYLLNKLVKHHKRIQRLYIYEWSADGVDVNWDSGLVAPDGTARPALNVLRKYLHLSPVDLNAPAT